MEVWLNGTFVKRDEARISAFDAGFQHAVGLFETMLARQGRVFRPRRHVERLAGSARELLLSERIQVDPLVEAVQHALDHSELEDARIRLTVTGGDLNYLQSTGQKQVDPTIMIACQPPTAYPDTFFTRGVRVTVADGRENPFDPHAGHKTLSYWPRIHALQIAGTKEAAEALWFTVSNHLASGSVSNVFIVKDGELLTPYARGEEVAGAVPAPVLPGITRQAIIELAEARNMTVQRKMLDIDDVLGAAEVFLTNSSWGVLPVVSVEKERIAAGEPGEITTQLREDWLTLVEEETYVSDQE